MAWLTTRRGERGATTVEYALMVAALAIGLALIIGGLMEGLDAAFDATVDGIGD